MLYLQFFSSIHAQLGIMTWPLTLLSALMIMLIFERSIFAALNTKTRSKSLQQEIYALSLTDDKQLEQYVNTHHQDKATLSQGLPLIQNRKACP